MSLNIGDIVKHYKGNYYLIVGFARHTETLDQLIIYRGYDLENNIASVEFWARPSSMFNDYIDATGTQRFTLVRKNGD